MATRSRPSYSDSEYWLSNQPGTEPEATYRGRPGAEVSNLCTSVRCGTLRGSGAGSHPGSWPPPGTMPAKRWWAAT